MGRIFSILLLVAFIGVVVVYHEPITTQSDLFLLSRNVKAALAVGDSLQATQLYRDGLKRHPGNATLMIALAELYQQREQPVLAEKLYLRVLQQDPKNRDALMGDAQLLTKTMRLNEARNTLLKIIRQNPKDADALSAMGDAYRKAGDNPIEGRKEVKRWLYDWAVYFYRRALAVDPTRYQTRFSLAVVDQLLDKPNQAAIHYCNALLVSPESFEPRYNLGLTLVSMGAYEAAYQEFGRAINSLSNQNRIDEARQLAEQVQTVKNMVFYQHDANQDKNMATSIDPPAELAPCLAGAAATEDATHQYEKP